MAFFFFFKRNHLRDTFVQAIFYHEPSSTEVPSCSQTPVSRFLDLSSTQRFRKQQQNGAAVVKMVDFRRSKLALTRVLHSNVPGS